MTEGFRATIIAAALLLAACQGNNSAERSATTTTEDATPVVVFETTAGPIVMELNRAKAPLSVRNFVALVRAGFYDGLVFHRVMPGFMIQAGAYTPEMAMRHASIAPVPYEGDNGLSNARGTVAMARTSDPNSATTQFFINLVDNGSKLDQDSVPTGVGYSVFGRVIQGMDVVDSIARVPTTVRGDQRNWPVQPMVITRAYVRETTDRDSS